MSSGKSGPIPIADETAPGGNEKSKDEILDAVRTVADGEDYLSPPLAKMMMKQVRSILLVDDNPADVEIATYYLKASGRDKSVFFLH